MKSISTTVIHVLLGLLCVTAGHSFGASAIPGRGTQQGRPTPSSNQNSPPSNNSSPSGGIPNRSPTAAIIFTSMGDMIFELTPDQDPEAVRWFTKLAADGTYDNTCFHRVTDKLLIQGGDALTKDPSREADWGKLNAPVNHKLEYTLSREPAVPGTIFFPPGKGGSFAGPQFAILQYSLPRDQNAARPHHVNGRMEALVTNKYGIFDGVPYRRTWSVNGFGKLISGQNVLDAISQVNCTFPESECVPRTVSVVNNTFSIETMRAEIFEERWNRGIKPLPTLPVVDIIVYKILTGPMDITNRIAQLRAEALKAYASLGIDRSKPRSDRTYVKPTFQSVAKARRPADSASPSSSSLSPSGSYAYSCLTCEKKEGGYSTYDDARASADAHKQSADALEVLNNGARAQKHTVIVNEPRTRRR